MLLFIDPGLSCTGFAIFRDRLLSRCGVIRVKRDLRSVVERAVAVAVHSRFLHSGGVREVLIELPEVYSQRFWKGDPADLIDLAVLVGVLAHRFAQDSEVRLVQPKVWKGQAPKEIIAQRAVKALSEDELKVLASPEVLGDYTTLPDSLKHNLLDAVGIGLWALGR